MFILECTIKGVKETKTFNTEARLLDYYAMMSIKVLNHEIDGFEVLKINQYIDGELIPGEIIAGSTGLRLRY